MSQIGRISDRSSGLTTGGWHKPDETVAKLRQVDLLLLLGRAVGGVVRSIGVTQFTYYR